MYYTAPHKCTYSTVHGVCLCGSKQGNISTSDWNGQNIRIDSYLPFLPTYSVAQMIRTFLLYVFNRHLLHDKCNILSLGNSSAALGVFLEFDHKNLSDCFDQNHFIFKVNKKQQKVGNINENKKWKKIHRQRNLKY